ncbi:MAG: ROK family protein [Oscillospiraceae bacterium]|nr:ROK family protein [Oscillospiraceae bacterium]
MRYCIGVDLGGTNIAAGAVSPKQELLKLVSVPTRPERGAEAVADTIAAAVSGLVRSMGCPPEGLGVGSPGLCDNASGRVRRACNLGWDAAVPLRELLRARLDMSAEIANDADCAALGETLAGGARGCGSALMITLGTGIGGGFVLNGRIWSGWHGMGGEFGHFCLNPRGPLCTCGRRGCWEVYAGAAALTRQAKRAARSHPESALAAAEPDGKAVFDLAAAGDSTARLVLERYFDYVALGLTGWINALYPEAVIIGGGPSAQGEALLAPVRERVRRTLFAGDSEYFPQIIAAELGGSAGVIGAAALCIQRRDTT